MLEKDRLRNFRELLDTRHQWPCQYLFKFIVKSELTQQTIELFKEAEISFKESSQGKYVSLTMTMKMNSSDEVIAIYHKAAQIPGLIAL
jgi:putative lipoic acid-binding regulatory protein